MEETAEANETVESSAVAQIKGKESSQLPQEPSGCNALETTALTVSTDADWHEHFSFLQSSDAFPESTSGRGTIHSSSSHSSSQPVCANLHPESNPDVIVEELTLKNYKSPNLSIGAGSSSAEKPFTRKGLWGNFTRLAGGIRDTTPRDTSVFGRAEDLRNELVPPFGSQRPLPCVQAHQCKQTVENENRMAPSNATYRFADQIRTRVLDASGFPEILVKNTLKGKGVSDRDAHGIVIQSQAVGRTKDNMDGVIQGQAIGRTKDNMDAAFNAPRRTYTQRPDLSIFGGGNDSDSLAAHSDGINLRELIKQRPNKTSKVEKMHIFKQILGLVDISHSKGFVLQHLRPSYFTILPSSQIRYIGSYTPQESSGSIKQVTHHVEDHLNRKRFLDQNTQKESSALAAIKHKKVGEQGYVAIHHYLYPPKHGSRGGDQGEAIHSSDFKSGDVACEFREQSKLGEHFLNTSIPLTPSASSSSSHKSTLEVRKLEDSWYASPEELNGSICLFSSNIYSLGVLLFELFCCFETREAHSSVMLDLRHRILHPNFLAENPKEAGFCLWLLHPDPSSRPKARDIVLSNLISGGADLSLLNQLPVSTDEDDAKADLLLLFLVSLKEQKEKQAAKLMLDLGCLQADISEVDKRRLSRADVLLGHRNPPANIGDLSNDSFDKEIGQAELEATMPGLCTYEERLKRNIEQLENAYFSMRSEIDTSTTNVESRSDNEVLKIHDINCHFESKSDFSDKPSDRLGSFFESLCKYARYHKFEVCGSLKNTAILNSANVICSLSFDRDEEYFAAAGISKKIKIFEFNALLNDSVDVHYPVVEMPSKSKLSCVCWNNYIKNYLASTDYEGVVQLWDASTGQGFTEYREHRKRAWSVNFSPVDPTKLASGSDDCSVKVWSINERNCIDTIRNVANVCCVQFSSHSSRLLAFGSADYKIYCYDLRNTRIPWCTIAGHGKAVSFVKFLDSDTLVSASTDNTLKIWDLNRTNASGLSTGACCLTLSGHTNEKNFVGLDVYDGFIACGSETNEVYAYYKTFPMPITSHVFGAIDPITGQEINDDNAQFVSSVCWRGKSNMVVAANSSGSIKVLQPV